MGGSEDRNATQPIWILVVPLTSSKSSGSFYKEPRGSDGIYLLGLTCRRNTEVPTTYKGSVELALRALCHVLLLSPRSKQGDLSLCVLGDETKGSGAPGLELSAPCLLLWRTLPTPALSTVIGTPQEPVLYWDT